jgi:hypothetical protein
MSNKVCISYLYLFDIPLIQSFILADPTDLIGHADLDVIKRVREILTDATVAEVLSEDPYGPTVLRDAVRKQIFTICTRLRVSLILVNKLMSVATNLNARIASSD